MNTLKGKFHSVSFALDISIKYEQNETKGTKY